jgi:hypothetical protein
MQSDALRRASVFLAVVGASSTAFGSEGLADPPAEPRAESPAAPATPPAWSFELGGAITYATAPIRGGTTPFGLGFGGRAGFSTSHVYFGLRVLDFLGGKEIDVTNTALLYGAEAGYDVGLGSISAGAFTLRPRVGGGGISVSRTDPSTIAATSGTSGRGRVDVVSRASGSSSGSSSDVTRVDAFYVEPGVLLMFTTGPFFFALDANVLVVPNITYSGSASTWLSYGVQGQSGFRF